MILYILWLASITMACMILPFVFTAMCAMAVYFVACILD